MTRKLPARRRRIGHLKPYWLGNSYAGLRLAARPKRRGGRVVRRRYWYVDQDVNLTKGDPDAPDRVDRPLAVVKHWPLIRKDGFHYWVVPAAQVRGRRRKGGAWTVQDGRRQRVYRVRGEWITRHPYGRQTRISQLTWRQLRVLRRRNGERYHSLRGHLQVARPLGLHVMAEFKGDRRFGHPQVVADIVADVAAMGMAGRFTMMTLTSLGDWRARMRAASQAGLETVLLVRGRRPADWAEHAEHVTFMRGVWRARAH